MSNFSPDWNYQFDENGNPIFPDTNTSGGNTGPTTGNTNAGGSSGTPPIDTTTPNAPSPSPPSPPSPPAVGTVDANGNITTNAGTNNAVSYMSGQATAPVLPPGTGVDPKAQEVKTDELLKDIQKQVTALAEKPKAPDFKEQQASQATTNLQGAKDEAMQGSTYEAALVNGATPQMEAAQGQVSDLATVQGQYSRLMDFGPDNMPAWAVGARRVAEEAMAARGLGASSIAGAAITQAIMEAGLPIASADAQTYAQMDFKNLDNEQQALLENMKARVTTMLSDQAAQNAARQFNATNRTQTAQFFANLMSEVDKFNVSQLNSMKQFNATQQVTIGLESNKIDAAMAQFNAAQTNAIQRFYDQNQLIVDQSNAQWRRSVNTANTAADNEAQRINALNKLGISNTAMNNIWQTYRDYASWMFTAGENDEDRALQLALAAFNRDTEFAVQKKDQKHDLLKSIGAFAFSLFNRWLDE